jgi:GH25 family lysozyme M1 (1,4-beta-N-acetylmuramidase)
MIQQYSSKGKVNGINGAVDMDWLYDESILSNFIQEKVKESFAATASKVL